MSKAPQPAQKPLTRRQISRREKEERQSRLIIMSTAAVLALVVLIIGYGLIREYVLKPRTPVATVGGQAIRLRDYQKLVQYRRVDYLGYVNDLESQRLQYAAMGEEGAWLLDYIDQQISYVNSIVASVPYTVVDDLIEDEITRQEAALRGIRVPEDDVELELERTFGYDRNPPTPTPTPITATDVITETPVPTVSPMTYDEFTTRLTQTFDAMKKTSGFGETDFRRLIESSLLRQRLDDALGEGVALTGEHVHAQRILVGTQEEADAVVARLAAGEDWDALAAELSTDTNTSETGGDLGWFMRGQMGESFDAVVFAAEPDPERTLIVADDYGFGVVRVLERDPQRYLSEEDLSSARWQAATDWFAERKVKDDIVNLWESWMVPDDITVAR